MRDVVDEVVQGGRAGEKVGPEGETRIMMVDMVLSTMCCVTDHWWLRRRESMELRIARAATGEVTVGRRRERRVWKREMAVMASWLDGPSVPVDGAGERVSEFRQMRKRQTGKTYQG